MIKKIVFALLITLLALPLSSQITEIKKPKLVVFITIDGLKSDHLYRLYDRFGKDGLRLIMEQGSFLSNVEFNYISKSPVVDIASICTSTTPHYHGIVSDKLYSPLTEDFYSIIDDPNYHGIYSQVGRSPRNLMATTFTDMLKISSPKSKVFSIGLNPEKSIVMAGHNADGVVWIDREVNLASSDYYKKIPIWAAEFNASGLINNYLKSVWRPMKSLRDYLYPPHENKGGSFYTPNTSESNTYLMERFLFTTYANSAVSRLAYQAISQESLGQGSETDVLCLNYNVNTFFNQTSELNSAEKEDLYLSLDRDISILLKVISERVKIENTLIVFAGTQTEPFSQATLQESRMPQGKFEAKRYMALLNSLLMAKYGQARWVLNYSDGNIFLNNKEMESRSVNRNEFLHSAIDFLSSISGVSAVVALEEISGATGDVHNLNVRLNNSMAKNRSGDLAVVLQEGWVDVDIDGRESEISSSALQRTPVAFYGLNLAKDLVGERYFVTDIASTICHIMQVPYPNSSIGRQIILKIK